MPQINLEFTANVLEKDSIPIVLSALHAMLATTLPTDIETCKSRAIECPIYAIGAGLPNAAFVHCKLSVMPGRGGDILQKIGKLGLDLLNNTFKTSLEKLNLQITIEVVELSKYYFKAKSI